MTQGLDWDDPILGLDLSSKCIGVAVLRGRNYHTEHLKLGKVPSLPDKLHMFRRWLRMYVGQVMPAVIAIEAPFVGKASSAATSYQFNGVAQEALCKCICPVSFIHAPTWKKEICGRGNITTKQKETGAVMLALNHLNFDVRQLDEADALAVALCMRKQLFGDITR